MLNYVKFILIYKKEKLLRDVSLKVLYIILISLLFKEEIF